MKPSRRERNRFDEPAVTSHDGRVILRACLLCATCLLALRAADPPKTWVDPATGHRVVRLTSEPNSASLYFNQNGYTADGKEMVYTTPEGISALNLASGEAHSVVK